MDEDAAKALYEKAERLMQEQRYEASAESWLILAESAHHAKDEKNAEEFEERAKEAFSALRPSAKEVSLELFRAYRTQSIRELRRAVMKAMVCTADTADELCSIATILKRLEYYKGVIALYKKALQIDPYAAKVHIGLADFLHEMGLTEASIREYQEALRYDPQSITALWGEKLFLPLVYESEEAKCTWRARWQQSLQKLYDSLPLSTAKEIDRAFEAAAFHPNFLLAYQGDDIVADQKLYGELISRIATAKFPQYAKAIEKRPHEGRIRVGFVSSFLHWHSIFKTHGAWITKLDKSKFEVHTFYLGGIEDSATREIASHSHSFVDTYKDTTDLINKIARSELDVLIYLDIGMQALVQLLAALRLAPVQCNALGHPVTSGLCSIDYMLSSALMEPQNAQEHYSEKLVLLPNLSSCYREPDLKCASKQNTKNADKVVYLNVQNLLKLQPEHDAIYPKIALQVPNAEFHFIATYRIGASETFIKRLEHAFRQHGLDAKKFCVFHPSMKQEEFYGLLAYGDVVLDSLGWSGFNSTMEALHFCKPVVTMPGTSCRSRHSFAIVSMLGSLELIATNADEYVAIAVKLGDHKVRAMASEKIGKNKWCLFNDDAPIKALEEFLFRTTQSQQPEPS